MFWNVLAQFAAETSEAAGHSEESAEGLATFGVDPVMIAVQSGTFLILFILIRRYAFDKIVDILRERREAIEESLKNADRIAEREASTKEEAERQIAKARGRADEIIAQANEEAGTIVANAEAEAEKRANNIVERAEKQAQSRYDELHSQLKAELAGLVSQATEFVVTEKMTGADDEKLVKKAISEVEA